MKLQTTSILGVTITASPEKEILEYVFSSLENTSQKVSIFTPNPEMIMAASKDEALKAVLNQAQVTLPDGVGVSIAGSILKNVSIPRISGVDFLQKLCKESARKAVTVGFLGAGEGIALKTAECLQKTYPGLKVSFVGQEWESGMWVPNEYQENLSGFIDAKKTEEKSLTPRVHLISKKEIDILFVAFGHGKQEKWISEHIDTLPFKIGMGVGGAFDYLSGKVSRAPKLLQNVGLEWVYRLVRQPWRAKRQVALLSFISLILQEKFSHKS